MTKRVAVQQQENQLEHCSVAARGQLRKCTIVEENRYYYSNAFVHVRIPSGQWHSHHALLVISHYDPFLLFLRIFANDINYNRITVSFHP